MNFAVFFGVLVVLAGVSVLLGALFHIHFPLVRTAFALLLVFFGVRILVGAWGPRSAELASAGSAVMSDLHFAPTQAAPSFKYDVIFGRGVIDLTRLPKPERPMLVEVNAIFGSALVTIDPAWSIVVEGSSAFGEVRMPDQSMTAFGTARYRPRGQERDAALVQVRCNAVFGSCQIVEEQAHGHQPVSSSPGAAIGPGAAM